MDLVSDSPLHRVLETLQQLRLVTPVRILPARRYLHVKMTVAGDRYNLECIGSSLFEAARIPEIVIYGAYGGRIGRRIELVAKPPQLGDGIAQAISGTVVAVHPFDDLFELDPRFLGYLFADFCFGPGG